MKKTRKSIKKPLLIALIVIALLVGGIWVYVVVSDDPQPASPTAGNPNINYSPATETEKRETEAHKDSLANQQPNSNPTGNKKQVSVVITYASADSVNAYISGILEDGGSCKATFTKGSQKVTRATSGFVNVNTTNCPPFTPDLPSSGSWAVTVSYSSAAAEGESKTVIEVP